MGGRRLRLTGRSCERMLFVPQVYAWLWPIIISRQLCNIEMIFKCRLAKNTENFSQRTLAAPFIHTAVE